jgi:hypothetical protein
LIINFFCFNMYSFFVWCFQTFPQIFFLLRKNWLILDYLALKLVLIILIEIACLIIFGLTLNFGINILNLLWNSRLYCSFDIFSFFNKFWLHIYRILIWWSILLKLKNLILLIFRLLKFICNLRIILYLVDICWSSWSRIK